MGEAANAMVLEIARQFAEAKVQGTIKVKGKDVDNSLPSLAGMDFEERMEFKKARPHRSKQLPHQQAQASCRKLRQPQACSAMRR